MIAIEPFLTAYDPSDLPGGSVDPLGFDRGYSFLADKILPGLTNVASKPRYFSMLCAASVLADRAKGDRETPRARYEWRLRCVQRLERFWAVGNVVAAQRVDDQDSTLTGLRGVRYVQAHLARLAEQNKDRTDGDFRLLSRQVPYGAVGIYGTVADGLRLLDRGTLATTPDLGLRLADAFVAQTSLPKSLRGAVCSEDDGAVSLSVLGEWGKRAHVSGEIEGDEGGCLVQALEQSPVRARMAQRMRTRSPKDGEPELRRLRRIGDAIGKGSEDRDLREAIDAILAYEACYQAALLTFLRLLAACQSDATFSVDLAHVSDDSVLGKISDRLVPAVARFADLLQRAETAAFRSDLHRLDDVVRFLQELAAQPTARAACETVLRRHADVQHSKFDSGRPKMPWLEVTKGKVTPTLARALRVGRSPNSPDEVTPHAYRMSSAQALLAAGGKA